MVICLERGADLHIAQLMPLPLTVSCFSKIQIGFTFMVPAHPGSPGQRAVKRVCVCLSLCFRVPDIRHPNTCTGGKHFRYLFRNAGNNEWASEGDSKLQRVYHTFILIIHVDLCVFFAWIIIIIKDTVQDPKGHYLLCRQKWQYGKATVFIAVHITRSNCQES